MSQVAPSHWVGWEVPQLADCSPWTSARWWGRLQSIAGSVCSLPGSWWYPLWAPQNPETAAYPPERQEGNLDTKAFDCDHHWKALKTHLLWICCHLSHVYLIHHHHLDPIHFCNPLFDQVQYPPRSGNDNMHWFGKKMMFLRRPILSLHSK